MGLLSGIHILSLIGQQGAGKTSIGQELAKQFGITHIEASAVVRKVVGNLPRERMPESNARTKDDPGWLGRAIAEEILAISDDHYVILTGVREVEVHQTLAELGASLNIIQIDAGFATRLHRHMGTKCFSEGEFAQHELNELYIGLDEVILSAGWRYDTTDSPNIEYSVAEIRQYLGY